MGDLIQSWLNLAKIACYSAAVWRNYVGLILIISLSCNGEAVPVVIIMEHSRCLIAFFHQLISILVPLTSLAFFFFYCLDLIFC